MDNSKLLKIFDHNEWQQFNDNGIFEGSGDDKRDGYIHLSADQDQIKWVISRFFKGKRPLFVATLNLTDHDENIKWETISDGKVFPHLYERPLFIENIVSVEEIKD